VAEIVRCAGRSFIEPQSPVDQRTTRKVLLAINAAAPPRWVTSRSVLRLRTYLPSLTTRENRTAQVSGQRPHALLQARERELLPTRYVHVVFTLSREVAPLALQNKRLIYNLLFTASAGQLCWRSLAILVTPRRGDRLLQRAP